MRSRAARGMSIALASIAAVGLCACIAEVGMQSTPCPCAKGYTCCATTNTCVRDPQDCASCPFPANYWFVRYELTASPPPPNGYEAQRSVDALMTDAAVTTTFGTIAMEGDGYWITDPAKTYDSGGFAEHRHSLYAYDVASHDEGYRDPAHDTLDPIAGTYSVVDSTVIMHMPNDGLIVGQLTDDCALFSGVNLAGTNTDVILALKQGSKAPASLAENQLYLTSQLQFQLRYGATLNPDGQSFPITSIDTLSDLAVFDASLATPARFSWQSSQGFSSPGSKVWLGSAPKDTVTMGGADSTLSAFAFRPDGLRESASLFALGVDGQAIVGGASLDVDPESSTHRVGLGFMIQVDPQPVLSDLAGHWFIVIIQDSTFAGSDLGDDGMDWSDGDERPTWSVVYGSLTIDDAGHATAQLKSKNTLEGILSELFFSRLSIQLHSECLGQSQSIDARPCAGIRIPVFYVYDDETTALWAKLALDQNKKVMQVLSNRALGPCTPGIDCNEGQERIQLGIAIKGPQM